VAEFTGKALHVAFGATVLTGNQRTFSAEEEAGLVDASAGADAARSYLKTLEDGTATIEILGDDGAGGPTLWAAVRPGTTGNLVWGEEGNVAGQPRHTVAAIVSSRKKDMPFDDVVVYTVEFQFSGQVADDVYP
jgi:hypothetical protein